MDNRQKEINNLKDYKYGFSTDIENIQAPKGLNAGELVHVAPFTYPQGMTGTQETTTCQQVTVKFCLICLLQEQCYGRTEHSDTSSPSTTISTFPGQYQAIK